MNFFKLYKIAPFLVLAAFIIYATTNMSYGFLLDGALATRTSIIELAIVSLSLLFAIAEGSVYQSRFFRYWVGWILWITFSFFVLGKRGVGSANFIHTLFCPSCFFLFYYSSRHIDGYPKYLLVVAICLFLITSYRHIVLSFSLTSLLVNSNNFASSNFVYWPLCCLPFIFLVNKKYVKYALMLIMVADVIISQKRAPLIAIGLIAIIFIINEFLNKLSFLRMLSIIIFLIALYIGTYYFLNDYYDQLIGRMGQIREDEGSGRIPLWEDVINKFYSFNASDWIFGCGYGSIIQTGHTNAHNDALQMLYEYGIIGLIFYVRLIILLIQRTFTLKHRNSQYYVGYFACASVMLVMGAVSNLVVFNSFFAFICAYVGFVEAQCFIPRAKRYQTVDCYFPST